MGFESLLGIGGALLGAGSSRSAAKSQQAASDAATAEQRRQYDQTRADQAPFRQAGVNSVNRLDYLLGNTPTQRTREQIRAELVDRYTKKGTPAVTPGFTGDSESGDVPSNAFLQSLGFFNGQAGSNDVIDEAGLKAAIDAEMAKQSQYANDPEFGSLFKSFTASDFTPDPGYQFRLSEGQKGVERSAAARGGLLSGATLKGLTRYNQDFASNEYGNAYNRFNNDRNIKFNRLASLAGVGQTATNQIGQAGQNYVNNVSSNIIGAGNAQAAGTIGMGNALINGLNNYQQYNYMNRLNPGVDYGSGTIMNKY